MAEIATCTIAGIGSLNCPNDSSTNFTNIGCTENSNIASVYNEIVSGNTRTITSNNWPNHTYGIANNVPAPINQTFEMFANPVMATTTTSILQTTGQPKFFFGVALNGVKIAPAPATPFIFENTNTGEFNWDWVFEPTNNQGNGPDLVGLDCNSAHSGGQGYHYHGNMFGYAEVIQTGLSTTNVAPTNPIQIGWAADGFPILYRFAPDEFGNLTELKPSYQLKYGNRQGDGIEAPCGRFNGKYTNDYEFIACSGDLDECNGIERQITLTTSHGIETFDYFYVVTETFPQIGRCFVGFPDISFD